MSFEINGTSPPDGDPPGSGYQFVLPPSSGSDGQGRPVGQVGRPRVELYYRHMESATWAWFIAIVGASSYVSLTSCQVYNPYTGAWVTYSTNAILHRPTYEAYDYGGLSGVRVVISELE